MEELEGERKKSKDDKKKKKSKTKKISLKVPNSIDDVIESTNKTNRNWKKKGKFVILKRTYYFTFIQKSNFKIICFIYAFFRLKHTKSEGSPYMNNPSFTDIPRNTNLTSQKGTIPNNKEAKTRFRKGAFVTTAVQNKKVAKVNNSILSDNSDTDDSIQSTKKVKKKPKTAKPRLRKAATEIKSNKN